MTDSSRTREYIQRYPTGFGYCRDGQKTSTEFSQVRLEIAYKKSGFAAVQQLILPLLVVMLMVLVSPNLGASLWDVRIAIPSTALLTLVFLQQGYRQNLPLLPYLTFLDQIYAACYIVTFALFVLFVWASNKLNEAPEADREKMIVYLNRVDTRYQWIFIFFLAITTTLNYLFPLGR
jgi:quinol-cytochrome oxidoreductase complex cytochrome b subunit